MVLYFTSKANPDAIIYMGKDKYENEELIKYGWNIDTWFHVDKLSSAHVYVRYDGELSEELIQEMAQLTKAYSIQGNKKDNVAIVYTPWSNLKKTGDMDVGQVGFHNNKLVKRVHVETRANEVINRLNKSKVEKFPDLQQEKLDYEKELRKLERQEREKKMEEERRMKEAWKKEKEERDYGRLFDEEQMQSNADGVRDEDDFM